jgi:hypothetical protein
MDLRVTTNNESFPGQSSQEPFTRLGGLVAGAKERLGGWG